MILVLVAEIVSALVALALVIALLVQLARSVRAKSPAIASDESRVRHRMLSAILLVAVIVHGASATIYASGAHPLSYAFGWLALALCWPPASAWSRRSDRDWRAPPPGTAASSSRPSRSSSPTPSPAVCSRNLLAPENGPVQPRSRQRRFQKKGPESVEIPVLRGQEPRYSPWRFAKRLLRV